jgi:hypothetical protein
MTDQECAAVLRRHMTTLYFMKPDERAAIERAIELLEREAKREAEAIEWSATNTFIPRTM